MRAFLAGIIALIAATAAAAPCTPTLGADLTDLSHAFRRTRNIPDYVAGALVRVVWAGGPAGRAGINAGDVIQGVGSDLVQNVCDVRAAIARQGCGEVRITLRRGVETISRDVRLVDGARFKRKPGTCEGGDGSACTALARAHGDDIVLLRQACDLGDREGCFLLGVFLKDKGNDKDSVAAYEQACDAGYALACTNLGWMFQNGRGVRADHDAALRLFKRGCAGSSCAVPNNLGCVNAGRMLRDGIGVKPDHPAAMRIFRDVCGRTPIAGDDEDASTIARSCSLAGTELVFGKDMIHDIPEGLALLTKGCDGDDTFGCFNLGVVYEFGEEAPKDVKRAAGYYDRACKGGDTEACERLRALK